MNTYLFVELDESRLELLLDVRLAEVVGELVVGQRHALGSFLGSIVALSGVWYRMERCRLVLDVPDLLEVDVGDLFVLGDSRVVRGSIARQLGEVL